MSYADPPALTLEKFSLLCVGRFLRKSERAPEDAFGVEDAEDDVIFGENVWDGRRTCS